MLSDRTGKGAADAESCSAPSGNLRSKRKKPTAGLRARGGGRRRKKPGPRGLEMGKREAGAFVHSSPGGFCFHSARKPKVGPRAEGLTGPEMSQECPRRPACWEARAGPFLRTSRGGQKQAEHVVWAQAIRRSLKSGRRPPGSPALGPLREAS